MHKYRKIWLSASVVLLLVIGIAWIRMPRKTPASPVDSGKGGSVWGANYFPNISLVNHEGKTVRFFDDLIKDKVVAINFIYTSCPDACPMETARLLEVQKILGDRVGKDIFFYSITIDPENDTPEVLGKYVERFRIGPGWWFLTGDEDDITTLRKKLGIYVEEIQGEDSNDHNLSLVIGNQSTGRWMKRSPYENPYILANQLGSQLHNWKRLSKTKRDYADAPKLRNISTGENLFRTRCASCHTIGKGDIAGTGFNVGPDLLDIGGKRNHEWLVRWLMEPDKMLEEQDPLAIALFAKYQNVAMPNLRLNLKEAELLLTYIGEESGRIKPSRPAKDLDHLSDRSSDR